MMKALLTIVMGFWLGFSVYGQDQKSLLNQLANDNHEVVEALVLYPKDLRATIFEACQYPEILVKLDLLQEKSQQAFIRLTESYSQNIKQECYNLARYPEIIKMALELQGLSQDQLNQRAQEWPQDIRNTALKFARKHPELLKKVHDQQIEVERAYDVLLKNYDVKVRKIYQVLLNEPEILSILTENVRLAILVGDVYSTDPQWLTETTDSLHLEAARRNADELQAWKQQLNDDPDLQRELNLAAKDFASDKNLEMEQPPDKEEVVVYRPYPFWFGYPYWYDYPWWYPYPYWYHTGFYFGSSGNVVVTGIPSYYFILWFYQTPRYYARLHNVYWSFYYRFPNSRSGLVLGLQQQHNLGPRVRRGLRTYNIPNAPGNTKTGRVKIREGQREIRERIPQFETDRSSTSRVSRERANNYHRQNWSQRSLKRQPRNTQRQKPANQRQTTTRKRRQN